MSRSFPGGVRAVDGVDLEVADGAFLTIVGPSGSGKTTLLRLIAGLEAADGGSIRIGGRSVGDLGPRARDVAMVFQDSALMPHLTVFENLAFGLRARRRPAREIAASVGAMAAMLELDGHLGRHPATLSGGQRRRVALGRALVRRPAVLLLDEPLAALDAPLRASARGDLAELHRRLGTTTLLVTHDQAEALALGDRVAVLDRGRVAQVGPPAEVYDRPASRFVAEFVGSPPASILPASIEVREGRLRLTIADADLVLSLPESAAWTVPLAARGSGPIDLGLRPEFVRVDDGQADPAGMPAVTARVDRLEPLGHETWATLALGPRTLRARLDPRRSIAVGDRVRVRLDLARALWFDPGSGAILGP